MPSSVLTSAPCYRLDFFTHHLSDVADFRWWITAGLVIAYRNTWVFFSPRNFRLKMPMVQAFVLIGFFVWVAENMASFLGAWIYPHQRVGWAMVHFGKFGAWTLLVVLTFVIVSNAKVARLKPANEMRQAMQMTHQ